MSGYDVLTAPFNAPRRSLTPLEEMGVSGTAISGGYIYSRERNPKVRGRSRYDVAMDIIHNAAVVGAGMRFFQNLVAKPKWTIDPAKDGANKTSSDPAKIVADFVEENMLGMSDAWPRQVRRMAAFRFYGFGIHEWTMFKREDGLLGMESLEPRPWHTIETWDADVKGTIHGVNQHTPLGGQFLYIPRDKFVYLVDDALTDSPEGLGLWRHLVEPYERFKSYCQIENIGFERDLRGIPVGYAPVKTLSEAVTAGEITEAQKNEMMNPLKDFVSMQRKTNDTGIILPSETFMSQGENDETVTGEKMFDIDLLSASGNGFADLGNAIDRCQFQMAMLCGTENLLIGGGDTGSRALSEDKSRNLYLNVDGCLTDIVAAINKDYIPKLCILNRIPRNLWPTAKAESAAYLDAVNKSQLLVNLAQAGAVLSPDDPAVNELRLEAGMMAAAGDIVNLDAMNTNDEGN